MIEKLSKNDTPTDNGGCHPSGACAPSGSCCPEYTRD